MALSQILPFAANFVVALFFCSSWMSVSTASPKNKPPKNFLRKRICDSVIIKKSLLLLLLLQSCFIGAGQNSKIAANKENYFPKVLGIDLEGNNQELPQAFNNKFNLVIVAFKREQQEQVDSWIKAIDPILKEQNNLSFFEIPVIYELSTFKRTWVNNGMRFGISNKEARKRTITVYTNRDKFFEITKMHKDEIYALLIDKSGKILLRFEGVASSSKLRELMSVVKAGL